MAQGEADGGGSQTLERGLSLLRILADHPEGLLMSQVTTVSGLHRSIVHRLLVSLQRTGFAARDDDGRFTLGPAVPSLVTGGRAGLRAAARPILDEVARQLDATASLVEVLGSDAVTTVVAEPPTDGPRFSYRLGNRDPLDVGAGGLAAQAAGPPAAGESPRVAAVRTAGFIVTRAEMHPGAVGIAVPLTGSGLTAAFAVVTSRAELAETAVEPLRQAARDLLARLG